MILQTPMNQIYQASKSGGKPFVPCHLVGLTMDGSNQSHFMSERKKRIKKDFMVPLIFKDLLVYYRITLSFLTTKNLTPSFSVQLLSYKPGSPN